jgi:hypothetical protein
MSRYLSKNTKKLIYNCIVAPHFDYCASILWGAKGAKLAQLQILQNRGMRAILNCRLEKPIDEMLRQLDWLNVKQRLALSIVVLIKKMINREVPDYLCDDVQYSRNIHNYKTRKSNNFYLPTINSSFGQKSLFQSGLRLYNSLPENIKCIEKTNLFKKACITYHLTVYKM